jgi:hypothetical protein
MDVSVGTIGLTGTLSSLISVGGGNNKKCIINNTYGAAIKVSTVTPVSTDSFTMPANTIITLDNTNNIYAVGTANGTICYWSQRGI